MPLPSRGTAIKHIFLVFLFLSIGEAGAQTLDILAEDGASDSLRPTEASLDNPASATFDAGGRLIISESGVARLRLVNDGGRMETLTHLISTEDQVLL